MNKAEISRPSPPGRIAGISEQTHSTAPVPEGVEEEEPKNVFRQRHGRRTETDAPAKNTDQYGYANCERISSSEYAASRIVHPAFCGQRSKKEESAVDVCADSGLEWNLTGTVEERVHEDHPSDPSVVDLWRTGVTGQHADMTGVKSKPEGAWTYLEGRVACAGEERDGAARGGRHASATSPSRGTAGPAQGLTCFGTRGCRPRAWLQNWRGRVKRWRNKVNAVHAGDEIECFAWRAS